MLKSASPGHLKRVRAPAFDHLSEGDRRDGPADRTSKRYQKEEDMPESRTTDGRTEIFGVPWEDVYGYVQAIKHGDTIYLSGQLAHDGPDLVAPAPLDEHGNVTDSPTDRRPRCTPRSSQ